MAWASTPRSFKCFAKLRRHSRRVLGVASGTVGGTQCRDNRTRRSDASVLAIVEQLREYLFHPGQGCHFFAHVLQAHSGDAADGTARSATLQAQQLADLLQAEAQALRLLDEVDPIDQRSWIATDTTTRTGPNGQQATPLVIADRLNTHLPG